VVSGARGCRRSPLVDRAPETWRTQLDFHRTQRRLWRRAESAGRHPSGALSVRRAGGPVGGQFLSRGRTTSHTTSPTRTRNSTPIPSHPSEPIPFPKPPIMVNSSPSICPVPPGHVQCGARVLCSRRRTIILREPSRLICGRTQAVSQAIGYRAPVAPSPYSSRSADRRGDLRLLAASTAKGGVTTTWSPPPPRNTDPRSLVQRVALRRESCQVKASKVEVLKTDVRMPQQICLVICGLEELARHGAERHQAADSTGRSPTHDHQHGGRAPAPQRDRPADAEA